MKTVFVLIASTVLYLNSFAQPPVVYLAFVTHNEETSQWDGSTFYTANRNKLITLANYFQTKGAAWNMQSDWTYLTNVISKETGTLISNTSNKSILRWMYEDKGVEMDPHGHETQYIYPDLVKLMDSIGLPESKLIGGTLYNQPNGINTWTAMINGQNGVIFPSKFWKPTYMMGGGTPQHTADINNYGFWNPQSMTSYLTHDPSQPLRHMGVGCAIKIKDTTTVTQTVNAIRDLVNRVQSGQYPASGFYFQSIFFEQAELNNTTFYNKVIEITDSLSAIVASGKAQWKTMKQTYTLWETNYAAQMFMWGCDQITSVNEYAKSSVNMNLYPNPNNGEFTLQIDDEIENTDLVLYNSLGQRTYTQQIARGGNTIRCASLSKGIYYYTLEQESRELSRGKVMIE